MGLPSSFDLAEIHAVCTITLHVYTDEGPTTGKAIQISGPWQRRKPIRTCSGDTFDRGEFRSDVFAGDFGVVVGLHVDPEHVAQSKCTRES